jgi:ubiquinone/menaquinone biosynthesis C-methylase UbiE
MTPPVCARSTPIARGDAVERAEFDQFADEYYAMHQRNIAVSGESPEYFAHYKIEDLANFCAEKAIRVETVLDFGAGIGNSIPYFRKFFPRQKITYADVSQKSLDLARERYPGTGEFSLIPDARLAQADNSQDAVFSACVFHHIPHGEHGHWLGELLRVTRPGGALAIFEHNPLNPLTLRAVNTCAFDVNAHLIRAGVFRRRLEKAGWSDIEIRYRIFFPKALAFLRPIEAWLTGVPFGAQYAAYARKVAV